jgi:hypothetical protein
MAQALNSNVDNSVQIVNTPAEYSTAEISTGHC